VSFFLLGVFGFDMTGSTDLLTVGLTVVLSSPLSITVPPVFLEIDLTVPFSASYLRLHSVEIVVDFFVVVVVVPVEVVDFQRQLEQVQY
jgi:hypothetical protein